MGSTPLIRNVRFWPGSWRDVQAGLLAYIELRFDCGLVAAGLTLRRSQGGRLYLSFPARFDERGVEHPILRPADAEVRKAIERQVLEQLGYLEEGAA